MSEEVTTTDHCLPMNHHYFTNYCYLQYYDYCYLHGLTKYCYIFMYSLSSLLTIAIFMYSLLLSHVTLL